MSLFSMFREDPFALTTDEPIWDDDFLVQNADWELIEQFLIDDTPLRALSYIDKILRQNECVVLVETINDLESEDLRPCAAPAQLHHGSEENDPSM